MSQGLAMFCVWLDPTMLWGTEMVCFEDYLMPVIEILVNFSGWQQTVEMFMVKMAGKDTR